jgi:hypothetical protein
MAAYAEARQQIAYSSRPQQYSGTQKPPDTPRPPDRTWTQYPPCDTPKPAAARPWTANPLRDQQRLHRMEAPECADISDTHYHVEDEYSDDDREDDHLDDDAAHELAAVPGTQREPPETMACFDALYNGTCTKPACRFSHDPAILEHTNTAQQRSLGSLMGQYARRLASSQTTAQPRSIMRRPADLTPYSNQCSTSRYALLCRTPTGPPCIRRAQSCSLQDPSPSRARSLTRGRAAPTISTPLRGQAPRSAGALPVTDQLPRTTSCTGLYRPLLRVPNGDYAVH